MLTVQKWEVLINFRKTSEALYTSQSRVFYVLPLRGNLSKGKLWERNLIARAHIVYIGPGNQYSTSQRK